MLPNIKFHVISIIAIFAALGIGIYIGFTLDAQNIVIKQQKDIAAGIEERFNNIINENQHLKSLIKDLELQNIVYKDFIDSIYEEIAKGKLNGINIAIIETRADYMYSGIGKALEIAGANVLNVTTFTEKINNINLLEKIYTEMGKPMINENLINKAIIQLIESIGNGDEIDLAMRLEREDCINMVGFIKEATDCIILAGGSFKDDGKELAQINKIIIDTAKALNKPIIGIEKQNVNYSYLDTYRKYGIDTVSNIDSNIGKVSLILALKDCSKSYANGLY